MSPLDVPSPERLRQRAAVIRAVREHLHGGGYLEVECPVLVRSPALEPHLNALPVPGGWLHTSPEFALKRVLAAGLPRIFAITPCFRADEWGPLHTTEFTLLEWYRAGVGYRELMVECEALVRAAAAALGQDPGPAEHLTWAEAWARHAGAPLPPDPIEQQRRWINDVEPRLSGFVFLRDFPAEAAAFAVVRGAVAERFELYWQGVELANAFTELLDPAELRARWAHNNAERAALGLPPHPEDERLVHAVGRHPRASGIALGLDRLILLLTGAQDIREVRVLG